MPVLSAHQPHFFPWASYFLKIKKSDVFILLDDVQFRKNYFQNRCEIINIDGDGKRWLTVPIKKNISSKSNINEILVSEKFQSSEILSMIHSSYLNTPFYDEVFEDIKKLFCNEDQLLSDINIRCILWCLRMLDINTTTVTASNLNLAYEKNPSMRLVNLCLHNKMNKYISGPGGKEYMDLSLFYDNNIDLIWHDSEKIDFKYDQSASTFLSGLSILDMFFNIGYANSAKLINSKFI